MPFEGAEPGRKCHWMSQRVCTWCTKARVSHHSTGVQSMRLPNSIETKEEPNSCSLDTSTGLSGL